MEEQKILNELSQNTGTEHYYKIPLTDGYVYTDGVRNLLLSCGCYWLISDIGIELSFNKKIQKPFLILGIKVNDDKSAVITLKEDSDLKPIYEKEIPYTDFPLREYEFYIIDKVMLLKGEY